MEKIGLFKSILHDHNVTEDMMTSIARLWFHNESGDEGDSGGCDSFNCDITHFWVWIFIPVVFGMSVGGILLPMFLDRFLPGYRLLNSIVFKGLQGLTAGFILSVAIMHCIGEAAITFAECVSVEFGFPALAALMGVIMTWSIEMVIATWMARRRGASAFEVIAEATHGSISEYGSLDKAHHGEAEEVGDHSTCPSETVGLVLDGEGTPVADLAILLFGLSFHTFFIGTALGMSDDETLFVALLFHQFFEALALGLHLVRATTKEKSWKLPVVVTLVFSLSGPLGGFIGVAIVKSICSDPTTFLIIETIFNSFAGGILVFVGSVHMIAEEFTRQKDVVNNLEDRSCCMGWGCFGSCFNV